MAAVGTGYLPLDVYQTDKDWVIRAAVPGVDPCAVEVTFDGGTITIRGEITPPRTATRRTSGCARTSLASSAAR